MQDKKSVGKAIGALSNVMSRYVCLDKKNDKEILPPNQMWVILFIKKSKTPVYQKNIEQHLKIRRSSATVILQQMEKSGLIIRKVSQSDSRLKTIELTNKAEMLFSNAQKYLDRLENIIQQNIDKKDLEVFLKVIDQIIANLGGSKNC